MHPVCELKKEERKTAIKEFGFCIDKILTLVGGLDLPRSTATSIHPFVQYAKVTILEHGHLGPIYMYAARPVADRKKSNFRYLASVKSVFPWKSVR